MKLLWKLAPVDHDERKGNQGNHTENNEISGWKRLAVDQIPETGCCQPNAIGNKRSQHDLGDVTKPKTIK